MGRDRYRYDRKGRLTATYSDDSPFVRFMHKVGWLMVPGSFIAVAIAGSGREGSKPPENLIENQGLVAPSENHSQNVNDSKAANIVVEDLDPFAAPGIESVDGDILTDAALLSSVQSSAVEQAMRDALLAGQPVRWEAEGEAGYAVPSREGNSAGCRSVSYSLDSKPNWQSTAETLCP